MTAIIRDAVPGDVDTILALVRALADYERMADAMRMDAIQLHAALFANPPAARAAVAEADGRAVGLALYFMNFSTWTGRRGLYLEDLFVIPEARGDGTGKRLLHYLARIAIAEGCARMEWAVLDWNVSAIDFYTSLGAVPLSDWTLFRLEAEDLHRLATG